MRKQIDYVDGLFTDEFIQEVATKYHTNLFEYGNVSNKATDAIFWSSRRLNDNSPIADCWHQKKILDVRDKGLATELMLKSNRIGATLAQCQGVTAITDVTGFGLLGHLVELCEASAVAADIEFEKVPVITGIEKYLQQGSTPGGTARNFASYGHKISEMSLSTRQILCDPQTSGGLLISVKPAYKEGH